MVRTLITTHLGADFDAVAAVALAQRLWPGAGILFPGSKQESVRRAVGEGAVEVSEVTRRQIDPSRLERIVVCDCRQPDRLGVVAEWLQARPDLVPFLVDHHPAAPGDLVGAADSWIDPGVGSTTTLLLERLLADGHQLTVREATLALLGIYEDTGALTYATTAPRDLAMAARMLEIGGDLGAVRRYALGRLDPTRVEILHQMLDALEVHKIHGHRVGLVELDLATYVDEVAPLVSRVMEMLDLPLVIALLAEPERVSVIARGEIPGCDLGHVLAALDGGGHPTAASASVRQLTRLQVRERLLAALDERLPPAARVRDLMIREVQTLARETTVSRARALLNRWRVNAAPVTDDGRVVGVVTRQILDAAAHHGLSRRTVDRVMDEELLWVPADLPAEELAGRLTGRAPRLALVGDPGRAELEGLVTRMSLLRHLHDRLAQADRPLARRRGEHGLEHRSAKALIERLPPDLERLLERVGEVAREDGVAVYLVGGIVRDLLLGRDNRDVDLVVEGDGPHFARRLGAMLAGARVRVHQAFLTATITAADGEHLLDVASARSEYYRAPASLPEVQTSAIRQDLYRRDFTINALAIRLGPGGPELLDFFGGRRDCANRHLRVLHSLSFLDDPTRVLRALRFELLLDFAIVPETLRLIGVAIEEGVFERLTGGRLRGELEELLDRPGIALRALDRLEALGLLRVLSPRLAVAAELRERLQAVIAAWDWWQLERPDERQARLAWMLLATLAGALAGEDRRALVARLGFAGAAGAKLARLPERLAEARAELARPEIPASRVHRFLSGWSLEELLALLATGSPAREWVHRELCELSRTHLSLRGRDLVALGAEPGAALGAALAATLDARLDGLIDAGGELAHAAGLLGLLVAASAREEDRGMVTVGEEDAR